MYLKTTQEHLLQPAAGSASLPVKMEALLLISILLILWCYAPGWIRLHDETAGVIDQSIWLLVLLSMICFLLLLALSCWLLQRFLLLLALPSFGSLLSQFNSLSLWQQFVFYWSSFALLLISAVLSLAAIC